MTVPPTRRLRFEADLEVLVRCSLGLEGALDHIAAARPGQPGGAGLDGATSGGTPGDPVVALLDDVGTVRDPAGANRARRDVDTALRHMHTAANLLAPVVGTWAPHRPDPIAKRAAAAANANEPMCVCCGDEPLHRHSDVGGRLEHPMALGRWCYDFVVNTGAKGQPRLPNREERRRRAKGQPVRLSA